MGPESTSAGPSQVAGHSREPVPEDQQHHQKNDSNLHPVQAECERRRKAYVVGYRGPVVHGWSHLEGMCPHHCSSKEQSLLRSSRQSRSGQGFPVVFEPGLPLLLVLAEILPAFAEFATDLRVVHVPAAAQGRRLTVAMDAETDHAVGYLA